MHDLATGPHLFNNNKSSDAPNSKCLFTQTLLPNYVDHEHPPMKKQPFTILQQCKISHTVELILPEAAAKRLKEENEKALQEGNEKRFARVRMRLGQILEGDFFNQYIKAGDVVMRSEGRTNVDTTISISRGSLHLVFDREVYQRTGLQSGVATRSDGRKHTKARYVVDIDLRLPSMVRGRGGFDRVIWACDNVLNQDITWLFADLQDRSLGEKKNVDDPTTIAAPIEAYNPIWQNLRPSVDSLSSALVPHFPVQIREEDYTDAIELLEWLTLSMSMSPRLQQSDRIDPYLSRYQAPGWTDEGEANRAATAQHLVKFRWHGLITSAVTQKLLLAAMAASNDNWFGMTIDMFEGGATTLLIHAKRCFIWNYDR